MNTMKKQSKFKLLIGSAVLIIAVTIVSCGEDFLNAPPQGSLDEVTLANESGVEATLIGAYRVLGGWFGGVGGWGAAASNWTFGSVAADDAYKGSENTDQPDIEDIEYYTWGLQGASNYLNDKWRSVYEGVVRSNATIRLLNSVQESANPIGDNVANSIRGEALFLRAHFHFEGWKMWGKIPYFTEEDTEPRKRNDLAPDAIINLILADLDQAINLLPDSPRNGQVGRVTAWTAKAYKGRVQIYGGDTAGALTTLRDVRQNGPFALEESYDRVWTGFAEFQNGPETILAYQASVNDGNPEGDNANWGERLNFPHSGSPFGCCGFHQPSQNLANAFLVDGNGLPLALTNANWNQNDQIMDNTFTQPLDPRIDWTIGRDGVPYMDWGPHARGWIRDFNFGGPYSPKKNVHEAASGSESNVGWVPTQLNGVNLHIYRYADMLLLLAEAEVESGSLENARQIVNEVRARAAAGVQGLGDDTSTISVPIDDPSITWANYSVGLYDQPWTNQAVAREAVRLERRVELAMEGHRFFDLRRWGTYIEVLNAYTQVEQQRLSKLQNAASLEARHKWYPIPNQQVELSRQQGEDTLTQPPGW